MKQVRNLKDFRNLTINPLIVSQNDSLINSVLKDQVSCLLEKIERTVQIEASTVEIEERGVKLRLTVVDTPGYGDAINCRDWCVHRVHIDLDLMTEHPFHIMSNDISQYFPFFMC